jgi:hypothetical protein
MVKLKLQKITPTLPPESSAVSFVLTSQDDADHTKDWDYFAVFDAQRTSPANTQVVLNIVKDVFAHELAESIETGPVLQTLERILKECKDAVQKLAPDTKFNAVAVVFKGDHAYTSTYGTAKALYLDGTQVMHVDTGKEGNYASGSQKIEEGKVMILCTEGFFSKFPPKSLVSLTKPILADDLDELSAAVILKVDAPVVPAFAANYTAVSPTKVTVGKPKRFSKLVLAIPALVLVAVGAYLVVSRAVLKPRVSEAPPQNTNTVLDTTPDSPEVRGELTKQLDEANKVNRVPAQVFYDISITDAKAAPTELALGSRYIAVCDTVQGKIYVSGTDVAKFDELPQLFPGVKNLLFNGDTLIFTDNEGVKVYALSTKSVTKSYLMDAAYTSLGPASEYLGFTYALSGDRLVKFTKTGNTLVGAVWLQKPEFASGVSVDIDGSIYVLFANGNLEKYTAGVKDDFSIVGLDKPIQKPLKVVTNSDYKQLYVGDGAEGRLIAFDADGVLAFQLKPELGSEWLRLASFDISADEKTFYVLAGTKVYEFSL